MELADNPLIRRTLANQPGEDRDAKPRERLWNALLQIRERAAVLSGEIHRDLPDFTDHGLTHLDALWEMAALIAGPDYPLNPLEAFVLGGVFLIHDLGLGLAAWPGGPDEIKKGDGWGDALSTLLRKRLERVPTPEELANPPADIQRSAIQERLRMLHAKQAERLALASYSDPHGGAVYYLIDDPDLRKEIGPRLGEIAHSHWLPVSHLASKFDEIHGALTAIANCPLEWDLDLLKIAVLLRTADAAHLDARRAPGFLRALRRPEGLSRHHWLFQEHLSKPRAEEDRIVYTTAWPYPPEEVDAWWLCEETLRMVDRELHQVDALLADLHRFRLRARGVAGVESPDRLQKYIKVTGWTPVDARLHVSNVADLVSRLGGEQLYGKDPIIPLRELIQNASDAVRARRLLEGRPENWGRVTVRLGRDDQGPWVEVEDTGVGMSESVLSGPLLDFGTTYWGSALMREEHEGLWAKGFNPTGHFGIGFFSVFMWGHRIRVTSRRYRVDAQLDTRVLEFCKDVATRPLMRPANPKEQLLDGGSCVRVWLKKEPNEEGGLLCQWTKPKDLSSLCSYIAPDLDVDLYAENEGGSNLAVAAHDWLTISGAELLARLGSLVYQEEVFGSRIRIVRDSDGKPLGRAAIAPYLDAIITVGGLRASILHDVEGVFIGSPDRVSRDRATILVDPLSLSKWASEQARIIAASDMPSHFKVASGAVVLAFGGKIGELPIARRGENLIGLKDLEMLENIPTEMFLVRLRIEVDAPFPPNVFVAYYTYLERDPGHGIKDLIKVALAKAWGCQPEEVRERVQGGRVHLRLTRAQKASIYDTFSFTKPKRSKRFGQDD